MQATVPPPTNNSFSRNIGYFLAAPITTLVIGVVILAFVVAGYQSRHNGRIYTGISVAGIDLSELDMAEAEAILASTFVDANTQQITFTDLATNQTWSMTAADLGMRIDPAATTQAAYDVGREGNPFAQMQAMYQSWYYGHSVAPVLVLDEGQLVTSLDSIASELYQAPVNAQVRLNGETAVYTPGQNGRALDTANLRERLLQPITALQPAQIELLVHDIAPIINDPAETSADIQYTIGSPVTFYLAEPLDELDLDPITLTAAQLANWLRVEVVESTDGTYTHQTLVDEVALRVWLEQYAADLYREPTNARFYFDDNTRELVLVAPHVNGRSLNIDATIQQLKSQINTPNRSVPFVVDEIVPTVNENATAAELGITELITETTTWFYGSTDARKHNIARSAANFFGIVIAPGEEFSFNKYLGSISEAEGYEQGFIIINGQTIEGIGGGVCQVSTTIYQTAFLSGFPISERMPHGYMLGYYNDGEGPGMDATIFSPLVDFKFINNTPHHLLIENYYNTEFEALTFKFYSTSLGRTVEKEVLPWENVTEIPTSDEDRWEFRETLEPGTVEQVDWATEGADVTVHRVVYNADGIVIEDRYFTSNYIPVPNVFHYGPGVEPYDYSLVPEDD